MEIIIRTSKKDIDLGEEVHDDAVYELRNFLEARGFQLEKQEFKRVSRLTWLEQTFVRPMNYKPKEKNEGELIEVKTSKDVYGMLGDILSKYSTGEMSDIEFNEITDVVRIVNTFLDSIQEEIYLCQLDRNKRNQHGNEEM